MEHQVLPISPHPSGEVSSTQESSQTPLSKKKGPLWRFPGWESACSRRRHRSDPRSGRSRRPAGNRLQHSHRVYALGPVLMAAGDPRSGRSRRPAGNRLQHSHRVYALEPVLVAAGEGPHTATEAGAAVSPYAANTSKKSVCSVGSQHNLVLRTPGH